MQAVANRARNMTMGLWGVSAGYLLSSTGTWEQILGSWVKFQGIGTVLGIGMRCWGIREGAWARNELLGMK